MCRPSRRTFLGTVAGLALSSAGCLDRGGGQASQTATRTATDRSPGTSTTTAATDSPTPRSLGTRQSVGGVSVTVSNLSVRDSVLYLDTPDSMAVATRDGERYVLVSVTGSEAGPDPDRFSLVVDGDAAEMAEFRGGLDDFGPRYDPGYAGEEGYLPFVVPVGIDAAEGRVVLEYGGETATWHLDESHLEPLRQPTATFVLRTVDLPERIRRDDPASVRVAAENVSDVAGVFRGVLNVAGLTAAYAPYPFELDADPGETVVWKETFDDRPPDVVESVGFFLYTVAGDREVRAPVGVGTAVGTATATGPDA